MESKELEILVKELKKHMPNFKDDVFKNKDKMVENGLLHYINKEVFIYKAFFLSLNAHCELIDKGYRLHVKETHQLKNGYVKVTYIKPEHVIKKEKKSLKASIIQSLVNDYKALQEAWVQEQLANKLKEIEEHNLKEESEKKDNIINSIMNLL